MMTKDNRNPVTHPSFTGPEVHTFDGLPDESYLLYTHVSGLRVFLYPKESHSQYYVAAEVNFGAIDRKIPGKNGKPLILPDGIAHFLEHKMFENPEGTDSLLTLSELGADANAYTSDTETRYYFTTSDRFSECFSEFLHMITTPYFTKKTVKKEIGIISEEIRGVNDSPDERCYAAMKKAVFFRHPERKDVCGTEASIRKITPELLYAAYAFGYAPANMAMTLTGKIDVSGVLSEIDRFFPKTYTPVKKLPEPYEPEGIRLPFVKKTDPSLSQPVYSAAFKLSRLPKSEEERRRLRAVMSMVADLLFSASSDFCTALRDEGILASAPSFETVYTEKVSFYCLYGQGGDPEKLPEKLFERIEEKKREGFTAEEVAREIRAYVSSRIRSFDTPRAVASWLLLPSTCREMPPDRLLSMYRSLTPEDFLSVLTEYFTRERFVLSVLLPKKEK